MLKNIFLVSLVTIVGAGLLFGVKSLSGPDQATAPQNVLVSDARNDTVSISWITPERVGSKLFYGTTPALGSEVAPPGLSTAHLVQLDNLNPNTTYYFAVGSDDNQKYYQDGPAGAVPYTFRTLAQVENSPVTLAVATEPAPASAFKALIVPNPNNRVLAESTSSGNVGTGTTGAGGTETSGTGGTPNGATTWPTIFLAAAASLLMGLGFKLLKN